MCSIRFDWCAHCTQYWCILIVIIITIWKTIQSDCSLYIVQYFVWSKLQSSHWFLIDRTDGNKTDIFVNDGKGSAEYLEFQFIDKEAYCVSLNGFTGDGNKRALKMRFTKGVFGFRFQQMWCKSDFAMSTFLYRWRLVTMCFGLLYFSFNGMHTAHAQCNHFFSIFFIALFVRCAPFFSPSFSSFGVRGIRVVGLG